MEKFVSTEISEVKNFWKKAVFSKYSDESQTQLKHKRYPQFRI